MLSTHLFQKPPFKNLVVNGLVYVITIVIVITGVVIRVDWNFFLFSLAEDGRKMSKRLKNYPDPMVVVEQYGADALR